MGERPKKWIFGCLQSWPLVLVAEGGIECITREPPGSAVVSWPAGPPKLKPWVQEDDVRMGSPSSHRDMRRGPEPQRQIRSLDPKDRERDGQAMNM